MKKKRILLILCGGIILLTSCSKNVASSVDSFLGSSSFISNESNSSYSLSEVPISSVTSFNISSEIVYSNALEKYERTLEVLIAERESIKVYYDNMNINSSTLIDNKNRSYWTKYSQLISETKEALKDDETRQTFVNKLGEAETIYIENIDVTKIFYNIELKDLNTSSYIQKGKDIIAKINNEYPKEDICSLFYEYTNDLLTIINEYYIYRIYYYLYQDNEDILDKYDNLSLAYTEMDNDYRAIFKTLLTNDSYKDYTITYFELTSEQVQSLIQNEAYTTELVNLLKQEKSLVNSYYPNDQRTVSAELLVNLINIRKEIAKKMGYSSYIDYVYEKTYFRDYTTLDAENLIDNIMENSKLKSLYAKTKKLDRSNTLIGENDLLNGLEFVNNIVPESKLILKNLKTYGNYSFDYRLDKYSGSFETQMSINNDYYLFINASSTIDDFSPTFHEYGHYLGSYFNDDNHLPIDIAEIQSQGLEYLMSNYYSSFLNEEDTKYMIRYNIVKALYAIYSSSCISKFENQIYNLENPTIEQLKSIFNTCQFEYMYPKSFGDYGFTRIPHIYTSPGYYISYLASVIPALEIWAQANTTSSILKYLAVLRTNTYKYSKCLENASLSNPFTSSSVIDVVASRIDQAIV